MRRVVLVGIVLTAACGPKRPPPSFAPDPGLVEQIRELRMSTSLRACPGESFAAAYTAVLNDGALVPFETRYDEDHPPRLHVVFLERSSPDATPLEGGGWSVTRDPLATAMAGFRLTVSFRAKPSVTTSTVVTPDYSCLQHAFGFRGVGAGASGPQVTVRLGILRSPFYDRLLAESPHFPERAKMAAGYGALGQKRLAEDKRAEHPRQRAGARVSRPAPRAPRPSPPACREPGLLPAPGREAAAQRHPERRPLRLGPGRLRRQGHGGLPGRPVRRTHRHPASAGAGLASCRMGRPRELPGHAWQRYMRHCERKAG